MNNFQVLIPSYIGAGLTATLGFSGVETAFVVLTGCASLLLTISQFIKNRSEWRKNQAETRLVETQIDQLEDSIAVSRMKAVEKD